MKRLHFLEFYVYRDPDFLQNICDAEILYAGRIIRSLCLCPSSRVVHDHFLVVIEVDVNDDVPNYDIAVEKDLEAHMDYIVELMAIKDYFQFKHSNLYPPLNFLRRMHWEAMSGCPPHEVPQMSEDECAVIKEYVEKEKLQQVFASKYFDVFEISDINRIFELFDWARLVNLKIRWLPLITVVSCESDVCDQLETGLLSGSHGACL